jgi:hypothetical protein
MSSISFFLSFEHAFFGCSAWYFSLYRPEALTFMMGRGIALALKTLPQKRGLNLTLKTRASL